MYMAAKYVRMRLGDTELHFKRFIELVRTQTYFTPSQKKVSDSFLELLALGTELGYTAKDLRDSHLNEAMTTCLFKMQVL